MWNVLYPGLKVEFRVKLNPGLNYCYIVSVKRLYPGLKAGFRATITRGLSTVWKAQLLLIKIRFFRAVRIIVTFPLICLLIMLNPNLFCSSSKRAQDKDKESAPSPSITLQPTAKSDHQGRKRTLSQSSNSVPSSASSKDSSKSSSTSRHRKGDEKQLRKEAKVCLRLSPLPFLHLHTSNTGTMNTFSTWENARLFQWLVTSHGAHAASVYCLHLLRNTSCIVYVQ